MIATDLGYPTLTGDATLTVNILRNQEPPVFINEPYEVTIDRNQNVGANIFRVTATDDDVQVRQDCGNTMPDFSTLRKHAYSNILKILPAKNGNFQIKNTEYFSQFCLKPRLWDSLEPPQ